MEIWADMYHNGVYVGKKVSNTGKVVCDNGKVCTLLDNGAGYLTYPVANIRNSEGKHKAIREYAHRLVAKYFLPNPDNLPQVNHKDCDKSNNHVDNLEWTSRSANINHAHKMGRMKVRTENPEIDILSVEQVIDLYVSVKRDKVGISKKAREMGIPRTTASSVMNKRSRRVITDKIDAYLLGDVIYDRMLTTEDLGFTSAARLVKVQTTPQSNNKTGVTGVTLYEKDGNDYYQANWPVANGKTGTKNFSVLQLGREHALKLATDKRKEMTT